MLPKLINHTRHVMIGIAAAASFSGGFADFAWANELPSDAFASLSPGEPKEKPNRDYNGLPIGGWMVSPSLLAGAVYDNNIFQTPTNRISAIGTRIVPTVTAVRDEGIHHLTV